MEFARHYTTGSRRRAEQTPGHRANLINLSLPRSGFNGQRLHTAFQQEGFNPVKGRPGRRSSDPD